MPAALRLFYTARLFKKYGFSIPLDIKDPDSCDLIHQLEAIAYFHNNEIDGGDSNDEEEIID